VLSVTSDIDAVDGHGVLRGYSVGIGLIRMRYRESFFTSLIPQLQSVAIHLDWLVPVLSMGYLHPLVPLV
jgi:hypothetical protein